MISVTCVPLDRVTIIPKSCTRDNHGVTSNHLRAEDFLPVLGEDGVVDEVAHYVDGGKVEVASVVDGVVGGAGDYSSAAGTAPGDAGEGFVLFGENFGGWLAKRRER